MFSHSWGAQEVLPELLLSYLNMGEEWAFIATCDLVAQVRGRSAPYQKMMESGSGVGWVPADLALNALGGIASPNEFGALGDLRLIPVVATQVVFPSVNPDFAPTILILANQKNSDGTPWASCPRSFLEDAINQLNEKHEIEVVAAFEHEFVLRHLNGNSIEGVPFGFDSFRNVGGFNSALISQLTTCGLEPETFLPEYGNGQFEVTLAPAPAIIAADRAILLREIVRDTAKRFNFVATFAPLVSPDSVGNGVHVHLSLWRGGEAVTFDELGPAGLSNIAMHACAGILQHAEALVALTASSQISFLRLQPHRWSAGGICIAKENREALLRICPQVKITNQSKAKSFNIEYRAADATANPWIVMGSLIHAMCEGLDAKIPLENVIDSEIEGLANVRPLPTSLEHALSFLSKDSTVRSWFDPVLLATFEAIRSSESEVMQELTPTERCARYVDVY